MKSGLKRQGSLEEAGKTQKVWKPLKITDNSGRDQTAGMVSSYGVEVVGKYEHETTTVLSSILVIFESSTSQFDMYLERQQHILCSDMF
jgi:hypothetical protein